MPGPVTKKPRYEELFKRSNGRASCNLCDASYGRGHKHGTEHPRDHSLEKHPREYECHLAQSSSQPRSTSVL